MFYHLEGLITELAPSYVVVDCGGIGFLLNSTVTTVSSLKTGEKHKLFVSEAIGENNFDLFGFSTNSEKRCFDLLVSVSGIGPKAALSILSCFTPDSLISAIINNDDKALSRAPGVGKKTALRVILELKDKVAKEYGTSSEITVSPGITKSSQGSDAFAALNILGYSNSEISAALKGVDISSMNTEQIIKTALKNFDK